MTLEFGGLGFQPCRKLVFIRQRFPGGPGGALAQGLQRDLGAVLGFADDAREIAVADDRDQTGNGARAVLLQPREFRRRHLRSQHAAVQHAGLRLVVNETRMRENLVRNIEPLKRISGQHALCRWFGHGTRRGLAIQRYLVGELPVARPDIAGTGDRAVPDVERVDPDAQLIGRGGKEDLPDLGTGLPDGTA